MNKEIVKRFVVFSVSNVPGSLTILLLTWFFSDLVFSSYLGRYVLSTAIAFEISLFVDFLMFYNVVWRDRIEHRSMADFFRRFAVYNVSSIGVYLLRLAFVQLCAVVLSLSPVTCTLVSMLFSGIINFIVNERLLFAHQQLRQSLLQLHTVLIRPFTRLRSTKHVSTHQHPQHPLAYLFNRM